MLPLFSVVIPTYNQANFLKIAIDSVLTQTFRNHEVIIINNFSDDHTTKVIAEFNDPRIISTNFNNHGVIGAGRNEGIKKSRGEFIAFLDSDDYWFPEKLAKVAEAAETNPDAGLFGHNQRMVRDNEIIMETKYGPSPSFKGTMFEHLLFINDGPSTSATVVKKKFLCEVGGFSEEHGLITVEDYDLWLRLAKICQFHFLPEVLGVHNFHAQSSSAKVEAHLKSGLTLLDKYCSKPIGGASTYPKKLVRPLYAQTLFGAARQYQRKGDFKKPMMYYLQALKLYPFHKKTFAGLGLLIVDRLVGHRTRRFLTKKIWGNSWRWG